jgi:hypothetical protein
MPECPSSEQVAEIEALFRVDAFAELTVCEECMGFTEFDTWLEQQGEIPNNRRGLEVGINWREEGF